jgi:hypothetical protein
LQIAGEPTDLAGPQRPLLPADLKPEDFALGALEPKHDPGVGESALPHRSGSTSIPFAASMQTSSSSIPPPALIQLPEQRAMSRGVTTSSQCR